MFEFMQANKNLYRAIVALVVILCLYFGVRFLSEARAFSSAGSGDVNTITLSGHGEVTAIPDIATVSFTIEKEAKTAKEAQEKVAEVEKKALEFLKTSGVEDKDIKASSASVYPKYEYQYKASYMPCNDFGCPPRGNNVIVGYTASESITVKVRNIDDAGKVMQGLGEAGVSSMNGPEFAIDEEDALKAEARKLAIDDAREKAKVLAKDLGVRLGKVVTFSESDYAMPFYARATMAENAMGGGAVKSMPAELPKGENTISAHVSLTFEIR